MREGRLVTASCTTGWLDWIHRELWPCDDGLLLVRLGLKATRAHEKGPTVSAMLRGRMADRLSLDLRDGASRKLLWMAVDRADIPLFAALTAWGAAPTSLRAFGRPE